METKKNSIHGLVYIGSDPSQVRLFWICVVIAGLTEAGVMIKYNVKYNTVFWVSS